MKKKPIILLLLRATLLLLILLDAALIFAFSAQDGDASTQQVDKVESAVTDTFIPDYNPEKPVAERTWIDENLTLLLRKSAHVILFGTLGALIFLFLLTWKGDVLSRYLTSLLLTLLYAVSDEIHQVFVAGRSGRFTDVLIDMGGALVFTTVIFLMVKLIRRKEEKLITRDYTLHAPSDVAPLCIAVAADLHGKKHKETLAHLHAAAPDLILIPGDLMDDEDLADPQNAGYAFLRECAAIAPTYYSLGNHEIACYHRGNPWRHPTPIPLPPEARDRIRNTGAILLDNESILHGHLRICGLTSGINKKKNEPNGEVLRTFAESDGYRILLCHHPEYYVPYIKETTVELTVCGHAHGGQWRVFSQGIYSPGQGIFPKYTAGVLDERCVISRGIGNHTIIPRIFNVPELVLIRLEHQA